MREETVGRVSWGIALAGIALMPAFTWLEAWAPIRGAELHGRFVLWTAAAALLAVPGLLGIRRGVLPWYVAVIGIAWLAWLALTSLLGGEGVREWGPTGLRWTLYICALAVAAWWVGMADRSRVLIQYLTAVAIGAGVPLVVGFIQFATGNAPMLNNAPRMTGTMLNHPVALSLVLGLAVLLLLPLLGQSGWRRWFAGAFLGLLYLGVMLTFTRATMLLVPPGLVAVVALAQRSWRAWRPVAAASLVAALAIVLSMPFVGARIATEAPMPVQVPGGTPGEVGEAPIPIDNSTGLRLETHLYGLQYLSTSPIFGHGPGSFDRLFAVDTGDDRVAAHNDLLQTAVETGVVGLILVLGLFTSVLWALLRVWRASAGLARWSAASVGVGFLVVNVVGTIHNPFYFPEIQLPLWVGVGILISTHRRLPRR